MQSTGFARGPIGIVVWAAALAGFAGAAGADSLGAARTQISRVIDEVVTVLSEDESTGRQVAANSVSGVGIDGTSTAHASANTQDVSFPPPGTLVGDIAYGGIDIDASVSIDPKTVVPSPITVIGATAEVFWGQDWVLTGTPTGAEGHLVDVVIDIDGVLDQGGTAPYTLITASVAFGSVYDEPGVGPIFGAIFEDFYCEAIDGGGDCYSDSIDASNLTVQPGFGSVTVSGQFVIPSLPFTPDEVFRVGPRLQLSVSDDLSTTLGLEGAVGDFTGSLHFGIAPRDPGMSVVAVPEPRSAGLAVAALVSLAAVAWARRRRTAPQLVAAGSAPANSET